ncbi:DNA topoisomerase III [Motilimonas pumila]|uniref:DNA topoisomerase 3 n=1 Tax=Motilimonas pumila TaxID=2303987 RepID=A0A418YJ70_9GAMM|nr:DNA topoisomerase III [Motilimonas pumila]RJG50544.1 DNA topoisomerase III [Motilimonas pumila]
MKLYIAEKPSLGRAIADALPKPHKKQDGYIEVGNGDCVSWCIGHLLEQAEPDAYDPSYKKWRLESLPIKPKQWQLKAKNKTKKQLSTLKKLIKKADQLVHAGDPDREGQLLVDEVIDFVGTPTAKKQATLRCLISDLNLSAVKKALAKLPSNREYMALSISALARSRADWLYGMNMTRAYTLQGQKVGFQGVLSVGRVQTPLLGLVVRRDLAIEAFQPKPFYEVIAHISLAADDQNICCQAKWSPSEACEPHQDEEGRIINRKLAENVQRRIQQQPALVKSSQKELKKQSAPLPYNLSSLQIDAAKRFSMSAKQVLNVCQTLYEQYKLITYPRSDCRYLPKDQHSQSQSVINTVVHNVSDFNSVTPQLNPKQKSRCWNDAKVSAHHAIIPTLKSKPSQQLGKQEQDIYKLICQQYLMQFLPAHEYQQTQLTFEIAGGLFISKSKQITVVGWKVFNNKLQQDSPPLPRVSKGDSLYCQQGELLEKQTQPPEHFTDATLLAAMTGISRFVSSAELKKILKETDGLGTEATRAGIIELLFKRQFLQRQGKKILATAAGRGLIASLPEQASYPDMTAHWEHQLELICNKQASYQNFMESLEAQIEALMAQAKSQLPTALSQVTQSPSSPKRERKKQYRRKPQKRKAPRANN